MSLTTPSGWASSLLRTHSISPSTCSTSCAWDRTCGGDLGASHWCARIQQVSEDPAYRIWMNWAGLPMCGLRQGHSQPWCAYGPAGATRLSFLLCSTCSPLSVWQIERGGGILKGMMKRVIASTTAIGEDELRMCLVECLETKNRQGTVNGFSPCQRVLGRNPRMFGWQDEVDDDFHNVLDPDPTSTFNRRGAMRESARLAWAQEDSHRRVRAALLQRGGTQEEAYRPGDWIAFKSACHRGQEPLDSVQRHPHLGRWQQSSSCQR